MRIPQDLIELSIDQNRKAQKQLYELLLPYLGAVANRYLRDSSYLKDALQDSFIKIFQRIETFNPDKAPFKSWAAKIVIHTCLNLNERVIGQSSEALSEVLHDLPSPATALREMSDEHLLFVLKKMPNDYFEVFNLFVIDGYSHNEIAELLHISPELSRKRLSRAKEWLKNTLDANPNLLSELYTTLTILN